MQGRGPARGGAPARWLAVAALIVGCGSGDQAPGTIPPIEGTYTGLWRLATENDNVSCPAALTVTDQVDSTFQTSFEVLRRNGSGVGCVDIVQTGSGVVRADRSVRALEELVEPVTCTLRQPNLGLSGIVRGDSITLSGRYTYRCPTEYTWTFRFSGSLTGGPLPAYPDVRGAYDGTWTIIAGGVQISCPVAVAFDAQTRDEVTGRYTLQDAGSCVAQPPAALSGVVSVDGDVDLSGMPAVPAGCTVGRDLALSGTFTSGVLALTGDFALICSNTLREFAVALTVSRP